MEYQILSLQFNPPFCLLKIETDSYKEYSVVVRSTIISYLVDRFTGTISNNFLKIFQINKSLYTVNYGHLGPVTHYFCCSLLKAYG